MLARGRGKKKARRSVIDRLSRHDLDAEAAKAHVSALAGSQQANGGNLEVLENLRAETDLTPLTRASGMGGRVIPVRNLRHGKAWGAIAQKDNHAAPRRLEPRESRMNGFCTSEYIADHISTMQACQDALAVADVTIDEGHVMHAVKWRHIGVTVKRANFRRHMKFADSLYELVSTLPVSNQFGDRNLGQLVFLRKGGNFGAAHHRTIVVHQLCKHADRRQ